MRLMSANLEYSTAWEPEVLPDVAGLLSDAAADVVAVQECPGQLQLEALANLLGGYACRLAPSPTGLHTGLLWAPSVEEIAGGDKYAERVGQGTWHGFTSSTLRGSGWPCPITVISAHLIPHSTGLAVGEAQFVQSRVRREGWPGVLIGDCNHLPLVGPEPDWETVPKHNRASRTILDQDRPDEVRGDRRVGLALTRGGLTDVAAHVATRTGDEEALAHTGVHGRVRVDQAWVSSALVPAIAAYERLDHRGLTDHHPIAVSLDLDLLGRVEQVEFH